MAAGQQNNHAPGDEPVPVPRFSHMDICLFRESSRTDQDGTRLHAETTFRHVYDIHHDRECEPIVVHHLQGIHWGYCDGVPHQNINQHFVTIDTHNNQLDVCKITHTKYDWYEVPVFDLSRMEIEDKRYELVDQIHFLASIAAKGNRRIPRYAKVMLNGCDELPDIVSVEKYYTARGIVNRLKRDHIVSWRYASNHHRHTEWHN